MPVLNLVMDILLLLFLAGTMFFAWHLSRSLNAFRKGRKDLDRLVQDLARHIDTAERSIAGMKNTAKDSGKGLQSLIEQTKALSDELQLMTESGDNLASRLERLAERNRDIADRIERAGGAAPSGLSTKEPALQRVQESKRMPTGPSFAIRDREYDTDEKEDDLAYADGDDDFSTKAERELFEALTKGRSNDVRSKGRNR